MNDVKESREREAKKAGLEVEEAEKVVEEELPFWKVPHEDGDGYCLLLSAEVRLELFGLPGENRTLVVPVSENADVVLHLADLRIEAFRDITLQNHRPESYGLNWYRREWKCEFHRIYNWAPYLMGCGLCATLLFFVVAFICRDSWEKKKTKKTLSKYESL